MKKSPLKHKPIIFAWIKQYRNTQQRLCDLCSKKTNGKKYFATYRWENYLDLLDVLQQLPSSVITVDHLDNAVWNTLIREQIEDLPQLKREDFCCAECTALQINLFMNDEGIAERVLAIPRLNKGHPMVPVISWVLFKPANNQDGPALIFAESTKTIEDVVEQAEGILKGGKIIPSQNWPR